MKNFDETQLTQFIGTTGYFRISRRHLLTDGTKYLAEEAECFWMMDAIASHLSEIGTEDWFVQVRMTFNGNRATMIYEDGNMYEQPGISNVMGEIWKGKADIISSEFVIDLKTTSNIEEFKYSARKYNYDSQAYIYNQIFGKPVIFIAVEKGTNKTGLFDCSDEFLDRGKEKVQRAVEVWRKFFGPNKTEDITQYYTKETL